MKLIETKLNGVYIIENYYAIDERGSFTKTLNDVEFHKYGLETEFVETYYSISQKNVIRGLHFQKPPYDHYKLVHVIQGAVIDVILDLRTTSKTYGEYITYELNDSNHNSIYIPKGLAHGFVSLKDNTIMLYQVSTVYNADSEDGIHWNTIGYDWNVKNPILSKRDEAFVSLKDFTSPF